MSLTTGGNDISLDSTGTMDSHHPKNADMVAEAAAAETNKSATIHTSCTWNKNQTESTEQAMQMTTEGDKNLTLNIGNNNIVNFIAPSTMTEAGVASAMNALPCPPPAGRMNALPCPSPAGTNALPCPSPAGTNALPCPSPAGTMNALPCPSPAGTNAVPCLPSGEMNTLTCPAPADLSRQQSAENQLQQESELSATLKRPRSWRRCSSEVRDGEDVPEPNEESKQAASAKTKVRKRSKGKLNLKSIPNMLYNSVKISLKEMSDSYLKKCIELLEQDTKGFGLPQKTLQEVSTVGDLISALETNNLFSEDNLYLMQFIMHEIGNKTLWDKLEEYSQRREGQPICLFKSNKKARGCSFVEFKIEGNVKHLKNTGIAEFRGILCKNLGIKRHNINLVGIQDGSIILIFQLPEFGVQLLRSSIEGQDTWLNECGVTEVTIDRKERYIYAKCDKFSDQIQPANDQTCTPPLENQDEAGSSDIQRDEVQPDTDTSISQEPTKEPCVNESPCEESKCLPTTADNPSNPLTQEMFDLVWPHLPESEKYALEKHGNVLDTEEASCSTQSNRSLIHGDDVSSMHSAYSGGVKMKHAGLLSTGCEDVFSDADSAIGSELNSDVPSSQESTSDDFFLLQSCSGNVSITTEAHTEKEHSSNDIIITDKDEVKLEEEDSSKHQDAHVYKICVKGRSKYELLMKIKQSLELMETPSETRSSCKPTNGRTTSSSKLMAEDGGSNIQHTQITSSFLCKENGENVTASETPSKLGLCSLRPVTFGPSAIWSSSPTLKSNPNPNNHPIANPELNPYPNPKP